MTKHLLLDLPPNGAPVPGPEAKSIRIERELRQSVLLSGVLDLLGFEPLWAY